MQERIQREMEEAKAERRRRMGQLVRMESRDRELTKSRRVCRGRSLAANPNHIRDSDDEAQEEETRRKRTASGAAEQWTPRAKYRPLLPAWRAPRSRHSTLPFVVAVHRNMPSNL